MMKYILLAISLCFTSFTIEDEDRMYWHEARKLQYDDFTGLPVDTNYLAWCVTNLSYDFDYLPDEVSITVDAYFIKNESYIIRKDSATLIHEQGHFDITELYARKFRKKISEIFKEGVDTKTFAEQIEVVFREIEYDLGVAQDHYDNTLLGTDYGVEQLEYSKKIASWLEEYKDYKDDKWYFSYKK